MFPQRLTELQNKKKFTTPIAAGASSEKEALLAETKKKPGQKVDDKPPSVPVASKATPSKSATEVQVTLKVPNGEKSAVQRNFDRLLTLGDAVNGLQSAEVVDGKSLEILFPLPRRVVNVSSKEWTRYSNMLNGLLVSRLVHNILWSFVFL